MIARPMLGHDPRVYIQTSSPVQDVPGIGALWYIDAAGQIRASQIPGSDLASKIICWDLTSSTAKNVVLGSIPIPADYYWRKVYCGIALDGLVTYTIKLRLEALLHGLTVFRTEMILSDTFTTLSSASKSFRWPYSVRRMTANTYPAPDNIEWPAAGDALTFVAHYDSEDGIVTRYGVTAYPVGMVMRAEEVRLSLADNATLNFVGSGEGMLTIGLGCLSSNYPGA